MFLKPSEDRRKSGHLRAEFHLVISVSVGGIVIQMGLAIQLDHRFGSKWLLNKFHWFGCTGSYACRDTKVQILLPRISDDSSILGTTIDEQINDEAEVDIELEGLLSIAATAGDDQVVSMHGGRMYKLSHSVCWTQYIFEHYYVTVLRKRDHFSKLGKKNFFFFFFSS